MDKDDEVYLEQKLEWVKYRLKILDEIEVKLKEMRELAILVRDGDLSPAQKQKSADRLHVLEKEVNYLDQKSRIFWLDCQ